MSGHPGSAPSTLYAATFIFAKGDWDEAFHRLDAAIAEVARTLPGYLGEESWENPTTGLLSNVYYWDSLASLQALVQHPSHLAAKARQGEWLNGYQVLVSQVLRCYGDGRLQGLLPTAGLLAAHAGAPPAPTD